MLILYSAEMCPFAQRVRSVLVHLDMPFELRMVDLDRRDPEFLRNSPTGIIPLLLDGDLKLYESQIISGYLAEKAGWQDAFSPDLKVRTRQRLAMKQWDVTVIAAWYRTVKESSVLDQRSQQRIERESDELTGTVRLTGEGVENLLGFHCAPFWARTGWLRDHSPLPELVDARPSSVRGSIAPRRSLRSRRRYRTVRRRSGAYLSKP